MQGQRPDVLGARSLGLRRIQLRFTVRSGLVTLVRKQCHGVELGGWRLLFRHMQILSETGAQTELGWRLGVRRLSLEVAADDLTDHGQSHGIIVKASRHGRRRVVDNRRDCMLNLLVEVDRRRAVGFVAKESVAAEDRGARFVLLSAASVQRALLGLLLKTARVDPVAFKEIVDLDTFDDVLDEVQASAIVESVIRTEGFLRGLGVLSSHEVKVSCNGKSKVASGSCALLVHRLGAHLLLHGWDCRPPLIVVHAADTLMHDALRHGRRWIAAHLLLAQSGARKRALWRARRAMGSLQ